MIISQVEDSIITRLRTGLGRMVLEVGSYGGEMDDALPEVIRRFPAAWVTFGGVSKTEPYGTAREKFKATAQFVVMVGDRNLRGESAGRHGGPANGEIGTNRLVLAVRRLLMAQDLALPISPLMPGRVRTLYNTRLEGKAFSVFACEFQTVWIEQALERDRWPTPPEANTPEALTSPDAPFVGMRGEQSPQPADWQCIDINYFFAPDDGKPDARDIFTRSEK